MILVYGDLTRSEDDTDWKACEIAESRPLTCCTSSAFTQILHSYKQRWIFLNSVLL